MTYTPNPGYVGDDAFSLIFSAAGTQIEIPVLVQAEAPRNIMGTMIPVVGEANLGFVKTLDVAITFDPLDPVAFPHGYIVLRGVRSIWKAGTANRSPGGTPPPPFSREWLGDTSGSPLRPIV